MNLIRGILRWTVARPQFAGALLHAFSGCASAPTVNLAAKQPAPARDYRPPWIQTIPSDIDAMMRCLDAREKPRSVVLAYHGADKLVSITTIDARGKLEHCIVQDGFVVLRLPSPHRPEALTGLPRFVPSPESPDTPGGTVLEEVVHEEDSLGWLYWPTASRTPLGATPRLR